MEPVGSGAQPPHPIMAFQVGVAGHRVLPNTDIRGLQAEAASQFRAIRSEVLRLYASDQASSEPLYDSAPPELRCICGLADGADFLFAEAALTEGWTLVATLPFAREEFEKDFDAGPRDRFRRLLGKAAIISELDGARDRGGEPYAHVGEQIVEQSDLLLVIWDGLPARGPGGTGDVVQRALERGVPIAALPPTDPAGLVWHGKSGGSIPALLRDVLLPPPDSTGFPQAYFQDVPERTGWASAAVRWYERAMLTGAQLAAPEPFGATTITPGTATMLKSVEPAEAHLLPYFRAADRLASEYAMRYRAAGLMRFGLILPATLGALLGTFDWSPVRIGGMTLQVASLFAVVAFSRRGSWQRSQERFIAYRALAEYLRSVRLLAPLGSVPRAPTPEVHQAKTTDWTAWYGRAVVRWVGLIPGRRDSSAVSSAAAFLRRQAVGQVEFLLGRAARFAALTRRLRGIGVALIVIGITAKTAQVALSLVGVGGPIVPWLSDLSLVLPALAPVFLGLLAFGEYGRLATRYQAVAAELQAQLVVLDHAASGRRPDVLAVGRRIADVMLAESADWQLLIKAGKLSAY